MRLSLHAHYCYEVGMFKVPTMYHHDPSDPVTFAPLRDPSGIDIYLDSDCDQLLSMARYSLTRTSSCSVNIGGVVQK